MKKILEDSEASTRDLREVADVATEQTSDEAVAAEHNPMETAAEATHMLHDWVGNHLVSDALQGGSGFAGALAAHLGTAVAGFEPVGGVQSNQVMMRALRRSNGRPQSTAPRINLVGGKALDPQVRARFEAAMNHDFSHVRIHTDGMAQAKASEVNAHAFAVGPHIFFGSGAFRPGTPDGDRLLAHELTHVVQHDEHRIGQLPGDRDVSLPTDPTEVEAYANERRVSAALDKVDQALAEHPVTTAQPMIPGQGIIELMQEQADDGMPAAVSHRMHAALGTGQDAGGANNHTEGGIVSRSVDVEESNVEIGPGIYSGSKEEQRHQVAELEIDELKRPLLLTKGRIQRFRVLVEQKGTKQYDLQKHLDKMDALTHFIDLQLSTAMRDFQQMSDGETKERPHSLRSIKQHLADAYDDLSTQFPECWVYVAPESQMVDQIAHATGVRGKLPEPGLLGEDPEVETDANDDTTHKGNALR